MNGVTSSSLDMPTGLRNKIAIRLLPLLCLLYLLNIMDRMNVGYGRRAMEKDLEMASWVFGWGFGIFYFGYLLFEVPANLILQRVGARRWMARIMITWGLVSCATALVTGPWSFFGVRILLGIAEAGFFPGIVYYLTLWFPARERGKAMALFMTGTAISGVIANPISGAIMQHTSGAFGLSGWQWLFILEGIPSILVGFLVYYFLPDGPQTAQWLSESERHEVTDRLRTEDSHRAKEHGGDMFRALKDVRVWLLTAAYFTVAIGTNCSAASLPKMVQYRFWDYPESTQGLFVALPSLCALFMMIFMGQLSDLTKMRRTMFAIAGLIGATGWLLVLVNGQIWPIPTVPVDKQWVLVVANGQIFPIAKAPLPIGNGEAEMAGRWLFLASMCLAQAGMISMIPTFWVMPASFLTGTAAAAGIALINSLGNIGGLVGPPMHDALGHFSMVGSLVFGSLIVALVRQDPTLDTGRGVEKVD